MSLMLGQGRRLRKADRRMVERSRTETAPVSQLRQDAVEQPVVKAISLPPMRAPAYLPVERRSSRQRGRTGEGPDGRPVTRVGLPEPSNQHQKRGQHRTEAALEPARRPTPIS